jgi:hypothetical protein
MAGKTISLRLAPERLEWADEYAKARGWTRTQVIEAGLEALRGDARGGVPEIPRSVSDPGEAVKVIAGQIERNLEETAMVRARVLARARPEAKCPKCDHRGPVGSMCPVHRSERLR